MSALAKQLLQWLRTYGKVASVNFIMREGGFLRISYEAVEDALFELQREGKAHKRRNGWWSWGPATSTPQRRGLRMERVYYPKTNTEGGATSVNDALEKASRAGERLVTAVVVQRRSSFGPPDDIGQEILLFFES